MGCGMHKISTPLFVEGGGKNATGAAAGAETGMDDDDVNAAGTMPLLEDPKDPIELGERIHIWWQVRSCSSLLSIYRSFSLQLLISIYSLFYVGVDGRPMWSDIN